MCGVAILRHEIEDCGAELQDGRAAVVVEEAEDFADEGGREGDGAFPVEDGEDGEDGRCRFGARVGGGSEANDDDAVDEIGV